jgi:hypothetical protein
MRLDLKKYSINKKLSKDIFKLVKKLPHHLEIVWKYSANYVSKKF